MRAALDGLRTIARGARALAEEPTELEVQRAGARIRLRWEAGEGTGPVDEVAAYARRFATGPALAYRLIKDAARVSEANDLKTQLALEANLQRKAGASEDAREGVMAFREKRAARYKGR